MAILRRLQEYLDSHHVHYEVLGHEEAYTAPEIAHTLHVSGKILAKVVMIQADERFVMAVLPSNWKIDFERLKEVLRSRRVRLATEDEFKGLFPDCEIGTMPPFGNLYDVPVYVDELLAEDEEIVFEAGTHFGAVKLRYRDFEALVHPKVAEFHRSLAKIAGNEAGRPVKREEGFMKGKPRLWAVLGSCVFALGLAAGCAMAPLSHRGGIMVDRWAEVNTDDKTVAEILAAFNGAEEGVRIGDLEKVMAIYSQNYRYHGMTKADLRKIWEAVFVEYHGLKSNHILSRIVVRSNGQRTAEITCSGSLYGVSKKTGEPVNVDSWYGEVHHVVYEEGSWRVEGHKGGVAKALPFGVAPHPFF